MPVDKGNKCILNDAVIDIIKAQYKNRSKIEVTNFLKELLYQDKTVQQLTTEYKGSMNNKTFWNLIEYLGLTEYIK
ncbi:MAG TPA: hypothetical protein GXZ90_09950 [Clostridiales bacterium]|nr:hypothetical protein [Clostridiales bacterium]